MNDSKSNSIKTRQSGSRSMGSDFKIIKGNLFDSKDSLAHCVSEDLCMGAGIALQFRQKIKRVSELIEQKKKTGDVAVLKEEKRFIYYLITKDKYYQKPSYDSLKSSLIKMREHMDKNNIKSLSIPKIGCGLDKLDWDKVLDIIKEILWSIDISVYIL